MTVLELNNKINELFNKAVAENKNGEYEAAIASLKEAGKYCFMLAKQFPTEREYAMKRVDNYSQIIEKIRLKMNPNSQPKQASSNQPGGKAQGQGKQDDKLQDSGLHVTTNTGITFDDVVGLDNAKKIIDSECVFYFKHKEIYEKFKHKPTKAILLYGVPGTGKTMFAKAVASEVDAPFVHISAKDLKDKYVGESEKNINRIFEDIKKLPYAIIFLDEAEEILSVRGRDNNSPINDSMVTNFLKVIDGFDSGNNFLFIAATNIPSNIDPAILSRCRYKINIALPNEKARAQIIAKQLKGVKLAPDLDYDYIARLTPKYSGRDLENLCGEITTYPIDRFRKKLTEFAKEGKGEPTDDDYVSYLTKEDVDRAVDMVPSSANPVAERQIREYEATLSDRERIVDDSMAKKSEPKLDPRPVEPAFTPKPEPTIEPVKPSRFKFDFSDKQYEFPPTSLLNSYNKNTMEDENLNNLNDKIIDTLKKFGFEVQFVEYTVAPQVIRFEYRMLSDTSANKINTYVSDISRALNGIEVNITQTIEGKDVFGIEVRNTSPSIVGLREIVESDEFQSIDTNSLTIPIGVDISNNYLFSKNGEIIHALISGATGSGKSVFINSVICSLLYKYTPADLRMILVDPKRVEFSIYRGTPHLLCDVINDIDQINLMLDALIDEMNHRYKIIETEKYKNIQAYNQFSGKKKIPLICLFIDEFADIIVTKGSNEFVEKLISLSSKGRASGIHIFLATQRPSADIIVSPIKTNFITRIAFRVPSGVDSRVILNESGAENLTGKGDMLFKGTSSMTRCQSPYVSDKELSDIMNFICK